MRARTRIGADSGRVIFVNLNQPLALSTLAASYRCLGTEENAALASRTMNGVHIQVLAIMVAQRLFCSTPQPLDSGETQKIMQKIVYDPPFRVEHVAPKQTHDDGAKHHGHQNDGEHGILAPEISLQQPGDQDPQYELDGNRKPHILKGEDEALPRISVR